MFDHLRQLLHLALLSAGLWLGVAALMALMAYGHPSSIRRFLAVRRMLPGLPAPVVFESARGWLLATALDAGTGEEETARLIHTGRLSLLGRGMRGPVDAMVLRRRLAAEVAWRVALLALVTLPALAAAVWLTYTVSPVWGWVVALLAGYQWMMVGTGGEPVLPAFRFVVPLLTAYLFAGRVDWWHPSPAVTAALCSTYTLVGMAAHGFFSSGERRLAEEYLADERAAAWDS
ncbi:hypothetical protein [Streptomyces sp. NPDC089799]|uniref:hypothetical protein n=1 Tax=Streptomyces sp. NPDC089799 TaxID=3155066 RepID=UPI003428FF32